MQDVRRCLVCKKKKPLKLFLKPDGVTHAKTCKACKSRRRDTEEIDTSLYLPI